MAHAPKARLIWAHTGIGGAPVTRVRELLNAAEVDEQLWLDSDCAALLRAQFHTAPAGLVYRVTGLRQESPSALETALAVAVSVFM